MLVTRTQGYREFGLTLGMGIIMTMVAALTVLPTLLVLKERLGLKMWRSLRKSPAPRDISYHFLGHRAVWLARHPGLAIAGIVILVAFVGYRGAHITMDYNYLNMEPIGLESVELQKKMIKKLNLSADYAFLTTSSLEEAHRLTKAAKDMSTSGMVQSIVDFLPAAEEQEKRREFIGTVTGLAKRPSPWISTRNSAKGYWRRSVAWR
jgi:predicted RND superfamily exporter protein